MVRTRPTEFSESTRPARSVYLKENKRPFLYPSGRRDSFDENPDSAFFIGKLDKAQNRDEVYTSVRRLGKKHNFYVRKLDMPYGDSRTKKGNRGYCFVHCKSKEEADRVVALKEIHIGRRLCEVKPYDGRNVPSSDCSEVTSGYNTPFPTNILDSSRVATTPSVFGDDPVPSVATSQNQTIVFTPQNSIVSKTEGLCVSGDDGYLQNSKSPFCQAPISTHQNVITVSNDTNPQVLNLGELYSPKKVNTFVLSLLLQASSTGDAIKFLSSYFEYLERFEKGLASMNAESVQTVANVFAPLLVNV